MGEKRFVFEQDDDSHWYKIPIELKDEFTKLLYDEDKSGKECWQRPEWQKFEDMRLNGGIENISFTNPLTIK